jgi:hypothetical protein
VPTLTRWFIKTALVFAMVALVLAAMLPMGIALRLPIAVLALQPTYFHLFMLGGMSQLVFGIAYWMFPVYRRDRPRRSSRLGWFCYVSLNAGLLLRAVSEPLINAGQAGPWQLLFYLAVVLHLVAAVAFVINTWGRISGA